MSELKVYVKPIKTNMFGKTIVGQSYYLKSEADKVIARHKYRRCLAMAYIEWLKQMTLCYYSQSVLYRRAYRRERKWKELAEKFKPNKSTAQ